MQYIDLRMAVSMPARRELAGIAVALVAVFILPAIVLLTLENPINQAGGLDAFIYTALVHDYGDVVARYGRAYYTTRIAFIYPARLFVALFGSETGYMLVRYLMLAAGSAAFYGIARRFFDRPLAFFAVLAFCFSPWTVRALMWDHYDGFAAIYLLIGMYFLLAPRRGNLYAPALAGAFYALAVNCNVFNIVVGGALFPAWLIIERERPISELATRIVAVLVGFVAAYAILALTVYYEFPRLGLAFETVSIGMVGWLLNGGAEQWFMTIPQLLEIRTFFLFPIGGVLAGMLLWLAAGRSGSGATGSSRLFIVAFWYLSIAVSAYLLMHFIVKAGVLTYHYYIVFLLPATMVAMLALAGAACAGASRSFTYGLLVVAGALYLATWFNFESLRPFVRSQPTEVFAALGLAPALLLAFRRAIPALAATGAISMFVTLPLIVYPNGHYIGLHDPRSAVVERDVYRGAVHLQETVARNVTPRDGIVGFWYGNEPDRMYLNSIQSTHLWGFSRLHSTDRSEPGMPTVTDALLTKLQGVDYVTLLGLDDDQIAAGEAALKAAGTPFLPILRDRFEGEAWSYSMAILEMGQQGIPDTPALYEFRLGAFSLRNGAAQALEADGLHLKGSPKSYNFSFVQRLVPEAIALSGPGVLYVRLKVTKGMFSVGLLKAGSSSDFIGEVAVRARSGPRNVEIRIDDLARAGDLVFREASADGGSEAVVYLIKVSRPE